MSNNYDFEHFGISAEPDDIRDFPLSATMDLENVSLPENYIVPQYRHLFDENFKSIPEKVREEVRMQYHDSCVGEGLAYQNSDSEKRLSARDCFRQAKRLDGNGVESFGTTLNAGQDAYVNGVATENTVPEPDGGMSRADYVSLDDVTPEVIADRRKSKSYWTVYRNSFKEAMYMTGKPIQTFYVYHEGDRDMRTNGGIMDFATGNPISGHCQTLIAWIGDMYVFWQSWGPNWGDNGLMYVPRDVVVRFGSGRITIDIPKNLAQLLVKYDGTDLIAPNKKDYYRCELGVLRRYPDEITWWAFGKLFGVDTYEIPQIDFDVIPRGRDMDIKDSPIKTRELVRQIRQHYGHL